MNNYNKKDPKFWMIIYQKISQKQIQVQSVYNYIYQNNLKIQSLLGIPVINNPYKMIKHLKELLRFKLLLYNICKKMKIIKIIKNI